MIGNPKWNEIRVNLIDNQPPTDHREIFGTSIQIKTDLWEKIFHPWYVINYIIKQSFFSRILDLHINDNSKNPNNAFFNTI